MTNTCTALNPAATKIAMPKRRRSLPAVCAPRQLSDGFTAAYFPLSSGLRRSRAHAGNYLRASMSASQAIQLLLVLLVVAAAAVRWQRALFAALPFLVTLNGLPLTLGGVSVRVDQLVG